MDKIVTNDFGETREVWHSSWRKETFGKFENFLWMLKNISIGFQHFNQTFQTNIVVLWKTGLGFGIPEFCWISSILGSLKFLRFFRFWRVSWIYGQIHSGLLIKTLWNFPTSGKIIHYIGFIFQVLYKHLTSRTFLDNVVHVGYEFCLWFWISCYLSFWEYLREGFTKKNVFLSTSCG